MLKALETGQAEYPHTDCQGLHLECRLQNEKKSLLLRYLEATGLLARTGQDLDLFFLIHVHVLSDLH